MRPRHKAAENGLENVNAAQALLGFNEAAA